VATPSTTAFKLKVTGRAHKLPGTRTDSFDLAKRGESVVTKFNRTGKFPYSCTIHAGMTGKVKVVAG